MTSHKPIFTHFYHLTYYIKDHLVTWIIKYIEDSNSDAQAQQILDDIDFQ